MRSAWLLLLVGACARNTPAVEPAAPPRLRPSWVSHLGPHVDAMRTCLELRESPRYVVFVEPLPSGATGVTTVDAYGAVEHCAVDQGHVARREPASVSERDITTAGGALFSLGPEHPIVPVGVLLEEVLENGAVLGWVYWPNPSPHAHSPEER